MNKLITFGLCSLIILMSACSTRGHGTYRYRRYSNTPSKTNYSHSTMRPYTVRGKTYYPTVVHVGDRFRGNASWYGPNFHGKLTSNGEIYNMHAMTAAHKTLPMNTIVRVTNRRNGLSTIVRINDRGPFVSTRIIDLSNAAARKIKMIGRGTAPVTLEILGFKGKGKRHITSHRKKKQYSQSRFLGNYALQIASFLHIKGALLTQEKYNNVDGYRAIIKDVESPYGRMFKVVLIGFKSEQEAKDYRDNSRFSSAFIVREE